MMLHDINLHSDMVEIAVQAISIFILSIGMLLSALYLVQIVLAALAIRATPPIAKIGFMWDTLSDISLPVSILVPAFNEAVTIRESVRSMLALEYPDFDVIVINDGSNDDTLAKLAEEFRLRPVIRAYQPVVEHAPIRAIYASPDFPRLLVIDKINGGRADALNAGLNLCRSPIFCAIDADSILEPEALFRVVQPFITNPEQAVAAGGSIRVANGCTVVDGRITEVGLSKLPIELFQTLEYSRAFMIGRLAWARVNALVSVSGAFGIFRRDIAVAVGGYEVGSMGEDLEIIVAIHRMMREQNRPCIIDFIPEPVCWTQVPDSLKELYGQRVRWQRGAIEVMSRHRRMVLNPAYGRIGIVGMGQLLVSDILGPIAELLGFILLPTFAVLGLVNWPYFYAFLGLSVAFGLFFSVSALFLEETELRRYEKPRELTILIIMSILESLGYRQLMNVFRVVGTLKSLFRVKAVWTSIPRKEFTASGKMSAKAISPPAAVPIPPQRPGGAI